MYKKGRYSHSTSFVLYYLKTSENFIGFVASKKVGNAVARNRSKRLLRALMRETSDTLTAGSYVLVAKNAILELSFDELKNQLQQSLKKVIQ